MTLVARLRIGRQSGFIVSIYRSMISEDDSVWAYRAVDSLNLRYDRNVAFGPSQAITSRQAHAITAATK